MKALGFRALIKFMSIVDILSARTFELSVWKDGELRTKTTFDRDEIKEAYKK